MGGSAIPAESRFSSSRPFFLVYSPQGSRLMAAARQEVPMLRKERTAGGKVKVTFSMPALEGVTDLYLVGSFNDWSDTGTPLVRGADGSWSAALTLETGWAYQYRYRDQDGGWHNDWAADSYVPNEFGSENSVVDLTDAGLAPSSATTAESKAETAVKKPGRKPAAQSATTPAAARKKKKA